MKLLDFFRDWNIHETDEHLRINYPAELQESINKGWIIESPDSGNIHVTERGIALFSQMEGNFGTRISSEKCNVHRDDGQRGRKSDYR